MNKKVARLRRAKSTRLKLRKLDNIRLCVNKTSRHMYAQIISGDGSKVLVQASTLEKDIQNHCDYFGNIKSSILLGETIAKRALLKGINTVSFDRSGFKYHGRVKALADSAREAGLNF
jgi:large subunit ribosomal protein L18